VSELCKQPRRGRNSGGTRGSSGAAEGARGGWKKGRVAGRSILPLIYLVS
jgi:hypothetical protein